MASSDISVGDIVRWRDLTGRVRIGRVAAILERPDGLIWSVGVLTVDGPWQVSTGQLTVVRAGNDNETWRDGCEGGD